MIRTVTEQDLEIIINLSSQLHSESQYAKHKFNGERLRSLLIQLIEHDDGLVLVYERDGITIGVIAAIVVDHYFSDARCSYEFGLYVLPEYRGITAGYQLAKAYVSWAKSRGAAHVDMSITTGITEERTGKLYQRMGFKHGGTIFSYEV